MGKVAEVITFSENKDKNKYHALESPNLACLIEDVMNFLDVQCKADVNSPFHPTTIAKA